MGVLTACPRDDREPLNDLIADRSKGITLSGTFLREQRFTIDKKICRRAIAIDQNHGKRRAEPLNVMESNQSIEGVESVTLFLHPSCPISNWRVW